MNRLGLISLLLAVRFLLSSFVGALYRPPRQCPNITGGSSLHVTRDFHPELLQNRDFLQKYQSMASIQFKEVNHMFSSILCLAHWISVQTSCIFHIDPYNFQLNISSKIQCYENNPTKLYFVFNWLTAANCPKGRNNKQMHIDKDKCLGLTMTSIWNRRRNKWLGVDNDGGSFCYDLIEMAVVDVCLCTSPEMTQKTNQICPDKLHGYRGRPKMRWMVVSRTIWQDSTSRKNLHRGNWHWWLRINREKLRKKKKNWSVISQVSLTDNHNSDLLEGDDIHLPFVEHCYQGSRGQCRNLHFGVPGYRPPKVISTHFLSARNPFCNYFSSKHICGLMRRMNQGSWG